MSQFQYAIDQESSREFIVPARRIPMSSTMDARSSRAHSPSYGSDLSSIPSSRSVMDLPMEGTKLAPKTFKGDPAQVEQFLRRFERLAMLHNLSPREKCETIVDYCSKIVRETIQGFSAYRSHNWRS